MTGRVFTLIYGVICYAVGMAGLAYLGLWLANLLVPNALDAQATMATGHALIIDAGLILGFALQHSLMARPAFKRAWTKIIPLPMERATYVLASGMMTIAVCYFWQPLSGLVWKIETPRLVIAMYALYAAGWTLLVLSSFWINHFDLFGLRQVWLHFRNRPYTHLPFQTPGLYRNVRHPLYLGWFMIVWMTPTMTISHLAFALLTTIYIVVATRLEERDLARALPEYERYCQEVPRFMPRFGTRIRPVSTEEMA